MIQFIETHREALEFAHGLISHTEKGINRAPVTAVIGRAFYHVERSKLIEFCETLQYGDSDGVAERKVVVTLHHYLISHKSIAGSSRGKDGGGHSDSTIYRKTTRGLDAFVKGERLTKIHEEKEEIYPIPEDGP